MASQSKSKPFIAVDLEGADTDGRHQLVWAGAGRADGWTSGWQVPAPSSAAYTTGGDPARTPLARLLDWLIELSRTGVLVGWWIDYDASMIAGRLPPPARLRLAERGAVRWSTYSIEHRPGRYFAVYHHARRQRAVWWDLGAAGGSLLTAGRRWAGDLDLDLDLLEAGKTDRGRWSGWTLEDIASYNAAETILTARVAERIRRFTSGVLGVTVRAWSVGGVAQAALNRWGGAGFDWPTEGGGNFARAAHHGGRHELVRLGPAPGPRQRVHIHDLRSAYASAAVTVPCLDWSHGVRLEITPPPDPYEPEGEWLGAVSWNLDTPDIGPFPVRRSRRGRPVGSLCYPSDWAHPVWLWGREIDAARRVWEGHPGRQTGQPPGITVQRAYRVTPCLKGCPPPLGWLESLYRLRSTAGPGPEHLLKQTLAAVWGKLAQRAGRPAYAHAPAAGLITAQVRAWILDAVRLDTDGIISIAGDSIVHNRKLPLDCSDRLGGWTHTTRTCCRN